MHRLEVSANIVDPGVDKVALEALVNYFVHLIIHCLVDVVLKSHVVLKVVFRDVERLINRTNHRQIEILGVCIAERI